MKRFFRFTFFLSLLISVFLLSIYFINRSINAQNQTRRHESLVSVPVEEPPRIAVVFGAGVWKNGEPSAVLYDRVVTAAELYRAGRVRKILMSGDNSRADYDEPTVMRETAVKLGVPAENIVLDYAGRRTYDTCWRAANIFAVKRAVLVTQEFHLNRALYLCTNLGIDAVGVRANRRSYGEAADYWDFRENFAVAAAWFDINIYAPTPIGGNPEPILQ